MENKTNSWNDDAGDWQNLAAANQVPRYETIARIVSRFCPGGAVLDVGCGEAVLLDYLPKPNYLGLEPSQKAAESARIRYSQDCIVHTTAEEFEAGQRRWDCIIFNEMLYYARAPLSLMGKYAGLLRPNGIIIISIFQKPEASLKHRLWRSLTGAMSNMRCTRMVQGFITKNRWTVEVNDFVAIPGTSDGWRIFAVRPRT